MAVLWVSMIQITSSLTPARRPWRNRLHFERGHTKGREYLEACVNTLTSPQEPMLGNGVLDPISPHFFQARKYLEENELICSLTDKNLGNTVSTRDWYIQQCKGSASWQPANMLHVPRKMLSHGGISYQQAQDTSPWGWRGTGSVNNSVSSSCIRHTTATHHVATLPPIRITYTDWFPNPMASLKFIKCPLECDPSFHVTAFQALP